MQRVGWPRFFEPGGEQVHPASAPTGGPGPLDLGIRRAKAKYDQAPKSEDLGHPAVRTRTLCEETLLREGAQPLFERAEASKALGEGGAERDDDLLDQNLIDSVGEV